MLKMLAGASGREIICQPFGYRREPVKRKFTSARLRKVFQRHSNGTEGATIRFFLILSHTAD
jgi:hypothetical protein